MKIFLLFLFLLVHNLCHAQQQTINWFFGLNAGITFTSGAPVFLSGGQLQTSEGCASLSDNAGNLLFYSNGNVVWAADHSVMPNGNGLNGSLTCSQSALFVPHPGNNSLYYLFTPPDQFTNTPFCYSVIDMTLNGGLGDVINKNTPLFSPSTEKVTAVRHANGTHIWVVAHSYNNADFYAYEISPAGINATPVISSTGSVHGGTIHNKIGIMKASPCGDKIALTVMDSSFVELFDFDNTTGIVSNAVRLGEFALNNAYGLYGLEFSPNGSRLYVTQEHPGILVQYDLLAGSPAAMRASADTIIHISSAFSKFSALQNGPDGKMYLSRLLDPLIACINNPDNLGAACNFTDSVLFFPSGICAHGLPNFMSSYFCPDQTGIHHSNNEMQVLIYPVPAVDEIHLRLNEVTDVASIIVLSNIFGQVLQSWQVDQTSYGNRELTIKLNNLASGVYFLEISNGDNLSIRKIIKQ